MINVIKNHLTYLKCMSMDVSYCCFVKDTIIWSLGADLYALGRALAGQRTWGLLSQAHVSDDALASLAATGATHLVLAWHGSIEHHDIPLNFIANTSYSSFYCLSSFFPQASFVTQVGWEEWTLIW